MGAHRGLVKTRVDSSGKDFSGFGRAGLLTRLGRAFALSDSLQAGNTVLNLIERSAQLARLTSLPPVLQVETTTRCNLNCVFCERDRVPPGGNDLLPELIEPIVTVSRRARETALFGYGEPLMSSRFYSLLEKVRSARVSFTTNGLLLTEEAIAQMLRKDSRPIWTISFSIDAAHQDTYRSIRRGASLDRLWRNIDVLNEHKRRSGRGWPDIWINFVAMRRNVNELPELVAQAAEKGVSRIIVFHLVVWDASYENESLLYDPELARGAFERAAAAGARAGIAIDLPAAPDGNLPVSKPLALPRCYHPWSHGYIRADGTVQGCCYSDMLVMGNLREQSFAEIWNGAAYRRLRETVNRTPPACCRTCEMRFRYLSHPDSRSAFLKFLD
jgi:MoaA/NifB/PqqE/SkfB family radical SAM enzyme